MVVAKKGNAILHVNTTHQEYHENDVDITSYLCMWPAHQGELLCLHLKDDQGTF